MLNIKSDFNLINIGIEWFILLLISKLCNEN